MNSRSAIPSALVAVAFLSSCSPSQSVDLAGRTVLRPGRASTLPASTPLKMVGSINQVCLEITPPDSLNWRSENWDWGVRRSDGILVRVGASLLHADSSSDTISAVGYSMGGPNCLTIGPSMYDSLHPPFVAVRLTVTDSLSVAKIRWDSWTGE